MSNKITKSAKGKECQIRIPGVCKHDKETVVWCHPNGLASGRGVGLKGVDIGGAYGCQACHDVYDRRKKTNFPYEHIQVCFFEGHLRSLQILIKDGLIRI